MSTQVNTEANTEANTLVTSTLGMLEQTFSAELREFTGVNAAIVAPDTIVAVIETVKNRGFEMISDIFGIDYLEYPRHQGKRFTVVYNLYSVSSNERIFIRVNLEDGEVLPTITHLWKGANFMEREVYDMFGIAFVGHPDLRKLLTPEDLEGHPHRKDFPLGESPTLFNEGRFLDPSSFRAGMSGMAEGLSGWRGGTRTGVTSDVRSDSKGGKA